MSTGNNSNPGTSTAVNSNPASTTTTINPNQSTQSHQNSNLIELEEQFILRMPAVKENGVSKPHPATQALREALAEQSRLTDQDTDPLRDRLFIDVDPKTRRGSVKFDDYVFEARLFDLPCIIESLKTKDKKMFYKTADICQILVCRGPSDPPWEEEEEKAKKKNAGNSGGHIESSIYQWPHGITPPLKNVRRKRFRKVAKKKCVDYVEIEREVKHLFRADREAVSVSFEVVYVEGEEPNMGEDDQEGERKKYDWDEDSMMSQDDNSSSLMRRSKKPNAATSLIAGGSSNTQNVKKDLIDEFSVDNLFDENSTMTEMGKKTSHGMDDTALTGGQLDRSNPDRNKNDEDLSNDEDASNLESTVNIKNLFVKEVIGDLSSSDEDEDDDLGDDDDQDEDNEPKRTQSDINEDSNSNMESKSNFNEFDENPETMEEEDTMDEDENSQTNLSAKYEDPNKSELNSRLEKLLEELDRIQEERKRREAEINSIPNPVLKAHLSSRLNNLIDEENKKKSEIEQLRGFLDL